MTTRPIVAGERRPGRTTARRPRELLSVLLMACGLQGANAAQSGAAVGWGYQVLPPMDPATRFVAVSAGGAHTVGLKPDGTVAAWGNNYNGECDVPVGLTNVAAVAAGDDWSLTLRRDGAVAAWGNNCCGQTNVPAGLDGVVAIAAGDAHGLALRSDGSLVAWGGFLGPQGGFWPDAVPPGLGGVVAIAAGAAHDLALRADHTVVSWGLDDYYTNVPAGLSNVVASRLGRAPRGRTIAWR